jgi:hypothetical protein
MAYHYLLIDQHLERTLQELEGWLGVVFNQGEIRRVFSDAEQDQVRAKRYLLYQQSTLLFASWQVEGRVEEYEPETLVLVCHGSARRQAAVTRFFTERW